MRFLYFDLLILVCDVYLLGLKVLKFFVIELLFVGGIVVLLVYCKSLSFFLDLGEVIFCFYFYKFLLLICYLWLLLLINLKFLIKFFIRIFLKYWKVFVLV